MYRQNQSYQFNTASNDYAAQQNLMSNQCELQSVPRIVVVIDKQTAVQPVEAKKSRSRGRSDKPKRIRTNFTNEQVRELENFFSTNRYMTLPARSEMAKKLQLNERQIKLWFQNRRMKEKHDKNKHLCGRMVKDDNQFSPPRSLSSITSSPSLKPLSSPTPNDQPIHDNSKQHQRFQYVNTVQQGTATMYNYWCPLTQTPIQVSVQPKIEENPIQNIVPGPKSVNEDDEIMDSCIAQKADGNEELVSGLKEKQELEINSTSNEEVNTFLDLDAILDNMFDSFYK